MEKTKAGIVGNNKLPTAPIPAISAPIFKMMDVTGKLVYTQTITGIEGTQKINATGLRDGVYYYEVVSDKKIMGVGKMVVIK